MIVTRFHKDSKMLSTITSEPPEEGTSNKHIDVLKLLDDTIVKKRFNLESIKNLDIFKQNSRLFIRLKMCIDENSFYEAHQAYKTVHFR